LRAKTAPTVAIMEKETSCINARAILDYVRVHQGGDAVQHLVQDLHPEIDDLLDPESFLRDPNNWISCAVIAKLYGRAKILLNDDMAAFHIARYAIEHSSMGYTQRLIFKGLWSVDKILQNLQQINDQWNRNKIVDVVETYRKGAVVRLFWHAHMKSNKDLCLNNQGVYTYSPTIWGGKPIRVTERCCYFEGAPYCEYDLKFPLRNRFFQMVARTVTSRSVLVETITEMERDKKIIEQKYEEVNRLNQALTIKIRQLLAVQETGKAILSVLDLDHLLTVIMNLLSNVCQIQRALIMLVNEKEQCLEYLHGVVYNIDIPDNVKNYRVPLIRVSNILSRVACTGRPEYVPDVPASRDLDESSLLAQTKSTSVYVAPLITRSKVIGVITIDEIDGRGIPKETRETLDIFTQQLAIAIENARLYRKLQEQMKELQRSHALLSRAEKFSFLGNLAARLAHEIKNPMTAIGTFIQLLPRKYDDPDFRKNFYSLAMEETTRVNRLITELLDLVKPRQSLFELGNLNDLMDKMSLLVSPQSNAKRIHLRKDFDPNVGLIWMDSEKMKEVILNLLSNAVEFTPEDGEIRLTTAHLTNKGRAEGVRLEIEDSGMGISPDHLDKIFDPYFTTKHRSERHNGTGLGLFIAYTNIEAHGGTIEARSTEGKGTVFTITIPNRARGGASDEAA